ncbi:MAG: hypothetical protein E6J90_51530 [Deltaproteobacteria bacterium]|nr:MAG: hypothetical protein E6J90_51530 [Deltaproteobacteria bacterium]
MTAPRCSWPPYLGPGWIAAYAIGLLAWLAIFELWGACFVVAVLAIGTLGITALGELLATGHVDSGGRDS